MTIVLVMVTMLSLSANANNGVWIQVNGAGADINITQDGNNNTVGADGTQTFTVNGVSNKLVVIQTGANNHVGNVTNMGGVNWGTMTGAGGDIYGDNNEFKIEQYNTTGTDQNKVGIHNYNQDGNSVHICQGKSFSDNSSANCNTSTAEYGGHTVVLDLHGNNNNVKISQETGSAANHGAHKVRAYFYNGDNNSTFLKQTGNGDKTAYITIRTDGGSQSIVQTGNGDHTATVDLTGSYKTDLDLRQEGNSNQSYSLTQNCQTSSGCAVSVTQGN